MAGNASSGVGRQYLLFVSCVESNGDVYSHIWAWRFWDDIAHGFSLAYYHSTINPSNQWRVHSQHFELFVWDVLHGAFPHILCQSHPWPEWIGWVWCHVTTISVCVWLHSSQLVVIFGRVICWPRFQVVVGHKLPCRFWGRQIHVGHVCQDHTGKWDVVGTRRVDLHVFKHVKQCRGKNFWYPNTWIIHFWCLVCCSIRFLLLWGLQCEWWVLLGTLAGFHWQLFKCNLDQFPVVYNTWWSLYMWLFFVWGWLWFHCVTWRRSS